MSLFHVHPKKISLQLQSHDLQSLKEIRPGMTVSCDQGVVWLTESNDPQDYTLRTGTSLVIKKQGQVLIEAFEDSHLSILYPN
jgi:hypothetical protein